jgi:hypothetical protein
VIPLDRINEHVQCTACGTRYRVEVLAMPTTAEMKAALPAGTRAAVVAMLRAGDDRSASARACAVDRVRGAGLENYSDAALDADLLGGHGLGKESGDGSELAAVLGTLAVQMTMPAHEWFLADVIRVGLADGQLSHEERYAAMEIAAYLGMTPAQAHGVITITEQAAAAG